MKKTYKKGFTLIEILLVIAAISILASIVIVAINPAKQLGETRNAQRRSDVNTILNAVWQFAIDNNGTLPSSITTTATPICTGIPASVTACTDATPDYIDLTSAGLVGLDIATQKYIVSLPQDPQCATVCAPGSIGYNIVKSANGRVTVTSLHEEQSATITVSR